MNISDGNYRQLNLICDIKTLLDSSHIPFWILGGWGIDFHLGQITREHSDIDLIIDRIHFNRALKIFKKYSDEIEYETPVKIKAKKQNIKIDICVYIKVDNQFFIDLAKEDRLYYPTPINSFPYNQEKKLYDASVNIISWQAQYVAKKGYSFYSKETFRQKDKFDMNLISENIKNEDLNNLDRLLPGITKIENLYTPDSVNTTFVI